MADVSTEIRRAVDSGKVFFGSKKTEKEILTGKGKIVVMAKSIPVNVRERIEYLTELNQMPLIKFEGTAKELGEVCGKPFVISLMHVSDPGKSKLLSFIETQ